MIIEKINFRDQIRQLLIDSILKEQLKSGQKLSLADYARDLKTSVTPVREAFTQLEQIGILESIPHVGFCVKTISDREAAEIYQLIGLIESNCLLDGYQTTIIQKLKTLADEVNQCKSSEERLVADNLFHETLVDKNRNVVSFDLLKNLKTRVFLFELQFMTERESNINEYDDHIAIIAALQDKNLNRASNLIKSHWNNSYKYILTQNKDQ